MLELIREKMQGTIATVIVVLLCAVFAFWGVETLFHGGSSGQAAVTVNGIDITEPEIEQATRMMRQRYTEMLGGKIDPGFLNDKMLREPAVDSLISRKLMATQVAKMKMEAAPVILDKEIVQDPVFSKDGKVFDQEYFKEKLRSAGMTPIIYRKQLADQIVLAQLQQGVEDSAFVTEKQVMAMAALAAQTRSFDYIRLAVKGAMDAISPTEKEIEQYFGDHNSEFMSEEKVSIEYIDLNKDSLAKNVALEDADIKASYEQEKAAFKTSVERHAAHILIEAKPDGSEQVVLAAIMKRLKAGEKFEVLAKEYSSDKESAAQGGDVGFSSGDAFVPEFESALAGLVNVGDVSEPVKSEFGYHIIKLLGKRDSAFPSFDERKADIEKQLRQVKVKATYAEKLDQLTESSYSANDLVGPATELKLDVQKAAPFGRHGGSGIAGQQKVIDAAFSSDLLDSGKNSQVIELSADRAIVFRIIDHQLPKLRELAEVKSQIINKLKNEQAVSIIKEKAEAIKKRIASGTSLKSVAMEEKTTLASLQNQKRGADGADAELVSAAFKLAKPAGTGVSIDAVQLADGDWIVLQLLAVNDVQPGKDSEEYKSVEKQLKTGAGNTDFSFYEQDLRQSAKIVRKKTGTDNEDGH